MLNITFTHSFNLLNHLNQIDQLRSMILITPVHPQRKLEMVWQSTIDRTYALLEQTEERKSKLSLTQVQKLISNQFLGRDSIERTEVHDYKKAFDLIKYHWFVVDRKIKTKDVLELYSTFSRGKLKVERAQLDQLLEYIQVKNERPVIMAGLIYAEMIRLWPFSQDNQPLAHLLSYMFLYKAGYDFEGLLVLENHFRRDETNYKIKLTEALKSNNLTNWLEYYALAIISQLETSMRTLSLQPESAPLPSSPAHLSDRQKEILALFDEPGVVITNKKVQKIFKVSQITASRDLSKLATLGLVTTGGKGRSVNYTKFLQK